MKHQINMKHQISMKELPAGYPAGSFVFLSLFCIDLFQVIYQIHIVVIIHPGVIGNDPFRDHFSVCTVAVDHDDYLLGAAVAGGHISLPERAYDTTLQGVHGIIQIADIHTSMNVLRNGKQNDLRFLFVPA